MNEPSVKIPTADRTLDVCGLKCPMPILRTKKSLADMTSGEVLAVHVTDPAAREDFAAFVRQTGHALMHVQDGDGQWVIYLRRK